jgi:hypothetical protein
MVRTESPENYVYNNDMNWKKVNYNHSIFKKDFSWCVTINISMTGQI